MVVPIITVCEGGTEMSVEENKAIVERWNREWHLGNYDIVDELAAEDYVIHPGELSREEHKKRAKEMRLSDAFSDSGFEVHDVIAEGDKVVVRYTMYGTHTGEYWGVPATNKVIRLSGTNIWRLRDGKIVEEWGSSDMLGMMQQLGLVPPM